MSAQSTHSIYTPSYTSPPPLPVSANEKTHRKKYSSTPYPENDFRQTANKTHAISVIPLIPKDPKENKKPESAAPKIGLLGKQLMQTAYKAREALIPKDPKENRRRESKATKSELLSRGAIPISTQRQPRKAPGILPAASPNPSPNASPVFVAADPDMFMIFPLEI